MEKKLIVAITGPTASGKSALAVKVARALGGEVLSCDSRQLYKGLNIGTGKISKREMRGIPHHLLDIANPQKQFSAAEWKERAEKIIKGILARGKVPIICGGTGFYLDALIGKISVPNVPPNPTLRARLALKSTPQLFAILTKLDPRRAQKIDQHNPRRLIRAIEIAKVLGKVPTVTNLTDRSNLQQYKVKIICLRPDRETLRKNIRTRLLLRMQKGMVGEVQKLHQRGLSWKRMEELGLEYRYVSRHLRGKMTKKEMLTKLETEIWQYAKRQLTWFSSPPQTHSLLWKDASLSPSRAQHLLSLFSTPPPNQKLPLPRRQAGYQTKR